MLNNNLDAEVAEKPKELIIYGGLGKAARNWQCYDGIVKSLKSLGNDETLMVQSGYEPARPIALDEGELVVKIWIGTRRPAARRAA